MLDFAEDESIMSDWQCELLQNSKLIWHAQQIVNIYSVVYSN